MTWSSLFEFFFQGGLKVIEILPLIEKCCWEFQQKMCKHYKKVLRLNTQIFRIKLTCSIEICFRYHFYNITKNKWRLALDLETARELDCLNFHSVVAAPQNVPQVNFGRVFPKEETHFRICIGKALPLLTPQKNSLKCNKQKVFIYLGIF